MAEKGKYESLATQIQDLVGGNDNVSLFTHCVTRLRFNVKDKGLVKTEEIEKIKNVVGCNWSGEQLQVIIGQGVGDAYRQICEKTGMGNVQTEDKNDGENKKGGFSIGKVIDYISGSITPIIPALIGCGMLKVLILVLEMCKVLDAGSSTYQLISLVGDSAFYFLPILAGKSAAKKLGANEALGMVIGAMLVSPAFVNGINEGTAFSFLGIPVYATSYSSTVFPVILSVAVMAPIQKFIGKHSPDMIRSITEPMITLLIMVPLTFCAIGPAGAFLGTYLSAFVLWLYNTVGFLGVAILAAILPLIIMTGMHQAFTPYCMNMMATVGYEPVFSPAMVIANLNQGAACAAVAFKTKKPELKSTAMSCSMTAIVGGVTEPGLYGVNLKYKKPLFGALIGSFVGGAIAGIFHVYVRAFYGSAGIFAIPSFVGEDIMSVVWFIVAIVVGMAVTFAATFILYKDEA